MVCDKCKRMLCMRVITYGKCKLCGEEVYTTHSPGYKLCPKCSVSLNKCEQCGEDIKDTKNN